eukprot:scaffold73785_cov20-Tisochrysis_lutea.AAC.1
MKLMHIKPLLKGIYDMPRCCKIHARGALPPINARAQQEGGKQPLCQAAEVYKPHPSAYVKGQAPICLDCW